MHRRMTNLEREIEEIKVEEDSIKRDVEKIKKELDR